jgi:phage terminase large subunit-like protein
VTRSRRIIVPPEIAALAPALANAETMRALRREAEKLLGEKQLELYRPYFKQEVFHAAGLTFRERLLMAGNQLGKTYCAGAEVAYHLTGKYPEGWKGRRFSKPNAGWAAGVTSEVTRDSVQRILVGRPKALGTGLIPKADIVDTTSARGIADALDTVTVKHVSGGVSTVGFKSYNQEREKFQAESLDWVWMDEEPPEDIYSEAVTRTNATGGMIMMTFTPLQGMSEVVRLFYPRPSTSDRFLVTMTIDDAEHISPEMRAKIIASYKPHEREARTRGIPQLGSGAVFALPQSVYTIDAFQIPAHWLFIIGIDLGFDHPFGAVLLAYDPDADCVYVINSHRAAGETIMQHAAILKGWGDGVPVAWPHDAASHDRQSAQTYAELYRRHNLNMLHEHATFPDGGFGLEASIAEVLDRMESGRFKVFSHLGDVLEELRDLHRKDGKVVKDRDDLVSAIRYGIMMLRFAGRRRKAKRGPLRRGLRVV